MKRQNLQTITTDPGTKRPVAEEITQVMALDMALPKGRAYIQVSPRNCQHQAIYHYADLPHGRMVKVTALSHSSLVEVNTRGFTHCVNPDSCRPSAHGYITIQERCYRCGAEREVNENGRFVETGRLHPQGHSPNTAPEPEQS